MIKQLDSYQNLKDTNIDDIEHIIITTSENEYVITKKDLEKILEQPMIRILLNGLFKS